MFSPFQAGTPKTILFVEDVAEVANASAALLRRSGFRVLVALDAGRALDIAEREHNRIDLIIADVGLDLFTGREVVMALRQRGVKAPVLFVSGGDVRDEFRNDRFLPKPWTHEELVGAVNEALSSSVR